jgi:hypothetical protein
MRQIAVMEVRFYSDTCERLETRSRGRGDEVDRRPQAGPRRAARRLSWPLEVGTAGSLFPAQICDSLGRPCVVKEDFFQKRIPCMLLICLRMNAP